MGLNRLTHLRMKYFHWRSLLAYACIKPTIFPVLSRFQPSNSTHMTMRSNPLHIHDFNHTHHQGAFNSHGRLSADHRPSRLRKKVRCQKWRLYKARGLFSQPICAKEERNGQPSSNPGLFKAKPRNVHVTSADC